MAARAISALCATAVLSAPAVLAQDSIARCVLSFSSGGSSRSVAVAAEVAEEAAVFVCDPAGPLAAGSITATATAVAEASATAFAEAVASASIACIAEGNSNFRVNGVSQATAEAEAIASAFASALGTAEDCNRCRASASFVASQAEAIWLEAVARLEIRLQAAAVPGASVQVVLNEFVREFVAATAVAYAAVLVEARVSAAAEGCSVDIEGDILVDANTNDNIPPSTISCEVNTSGISTGFAQDVVANATASVAVFACKNTTELVANITSVEFAIAVANAIAAIAAECEVSGGGFACVWAEAQIVSVVEACAAAFASGFADAVRSCKPECAVNATDFAARVVSIVSNATAAVYLDQCAGPNSSFNITIIQSQLVSTTVRALASVIATAGIDNGQCIATVVANASISDAMTTTTTTTTVMNTTTTSPAVPPPAPPVVKPPPPPPPPVVPPPPPPPPPVVKPPPPPPPPVVKPPPPPPPPVVKPPPPPPPPVVKPPPPPPPPVVKPPPPPPVTKPPAKPPTVTTKITSSTTKTPTSSVSTRTSSTVVVDGHPPPGTFVATTSSSAKATVTETGCVPTCAARFSMCFGVTGTSTCCDAGFVCIMKHATYGQCLPATGYTSYVTPDWAQTVVTCKH